MNKIIYLAGMVDGDGTFRITKRKIKTYSLKYDCKLRVINTSKELMIWLKNNFGGSFYIQNKIGNGRWKDCYAWEISSKEAFILTEKIIRYLIVKKTRAKLLLDFKKTLNWGMGGGKRVPKKINLLRENIYLKMKKLNERGKRRYIGSSGGY
jgi:hypothetical protein